MPIYEVGQHAGQHYFSMGLVDGQSLAQRIIDGPMAPREAAEMLVKVFEGIAYAHERGVIPRDLETIVMKCLEKEPSKRYESAQSLSDDVCRAIQTDHGPTTTRVLDLVAFTASCSKTAER